MQSRYSRPTSVTVICSLFLFFSVVGLAASYGIIADAENKSDHWAGACLLLLSILSIASGVFMLRGANWARILFLTVCLPLFCALTLVTAPERIIRLFFLVLLALRLIARPSNRFFTGRDTVFRRATPQESSNASSSQPDAETTRSSRRGRFDY